MDRIDRAVEVAFEQFDVFDEIPGVHL
jgi:hypothetical protein